MLLSSLPKPVSQTCLKTKTLVLAMALAMTVGIGCQGESSVFQPAVARLIEKAAVYHQAGQTDTAIDRLEAAADLMPESYPVQYNLGVLHSEASHWEAAITRLEKALTLSPDKPEALFSLGYAYESRGHQRAMATQKPDQQAQTKAAYQKALDAYQHYLEVAPDGDPKRPEVRAQITQIRQQIHSAKPQ